MHATPRPTAVMPDMANEADNEVTLQDIARFLKEGKRWIITTTLFCLFIGGAYALLAPAQYEATATIEMASVAGTPVEKPQVLADKLKLPLYYSTGTHKACGSENELPTPGEFLSAQLKPAANKNAPVVSIKYRQTTPQGATECLAAVLADVKRNQDISFKPVVALKKNQLLILQKKLDDAEKLIEQLPVKNVNFAFTDSKFGASALLLATLMAKESEVRDLRNQIYEMQVNLAKPLTQETSLATPIYASSTKVAPKSALIILVSVVGGIALGILLWATRKSYLKPLRIWEPAITKLKN